MRSRLFFILLGAIGLIVGALYFIDFLKLSSPLNLRLDSSFLILIILAVSLQLCAHSLRAYKSRYLLDNIRATSFIQLFRGLSVGFLFNTLLPIRLGEIIRAVYIGDALAISKTTVFMSIVIERIVDGFILGISFIAASLIINNGQFEVDLLTRIGLGVLLVTIVLSIMVHLVRSEYRWVLKLLHTTSSIFNDKIANRFRFIAWSGIYGTKLMLSDVNSLKKYLVMSLAMWLLYFSSTLCVILAFFDLLQGSQAWYIVQSTYASVSAPAGPAYLGSFHLILTNLMREAGVQPASSFSLFIWLIMIAPISLVGLYVLAHQRFGSKKDTSDQEMLINKLHRGKDISAELGHFLDAYLKGEQINQLLSQAELDNKFKLMRSFKGGSNAHTLLVWQNQELRVKKITLLQYADKLEAQAQWLIERNNLAHIPQVVEQDKTDHYYYFDLKYKEDYLTFFDYIHTQSSGRSFAALKQILKFMDRSVYKPQAAKNGKANLKSYIENKVLGKINDTAAMSSSINQLLGYKKLNINGTVFTNLLPIVEKISKHKQAMKDLSAYDESPIHGDLTIDNLIISAKGDFLILDPNNENQVSAPVVDYGKLYQSLHSGYEFLIQLEDCKVEGSKIQFEDSRSQKYAEVFQLVDKELKTMLSPKDYRSLLFHEAVHYCRMLTYRVNINPITVPIFYATAVKLFNEFIDQYD